jgi:hypothetical protein
MKISATKILASLAVFYTSVAFTAEDSSISVSIAIPHHQSNQRELEYSVNNPHFNVIITNTSNKPKRIWDEECGFGYYGLSFEFTDASGKTWMVKKGPTAFSANGVAFWTVDAHESLVLDVQFSDADIWEGFPLPQAGIQTFKVRAVFGFPPVDASRELSIWTGRVVSKTYILQVRAKL